MLGRKKHLKRLNISYNSEIYNGRVWHFHSSKIQTFYFPFLLPHVLTYLIISPEDTQCWEWDCIKLFGTDPSDTSSDQGNNNKHSSYLNFAISCTDFFSVFILWFFCCVSFTFQSALLSVMHQSCEFPM
jgi:hypothetical protein